MLQVQRGAGAAALTRCFLRSYTGVYPGAIGRHVLGVEAVLIIAKKIVKMPRLDIVYLVLMGGT